METLPDERAGVGLKTKAYKLAAELGVHEQSVLDWLRAHGYPNVRRADTIKAEVCQAARQALGRKETAGKRGPKPPPRHGSAPVAAEVEPAAASLRVSFAELLEAHLPADERPPAPTGPLDTIPSLPAALRPERGRPAPAPAPPAPAPVPGPTADDLARVRAEREAASRRADEWRIRYERARSDLEDASSRLKHLEGAAEALAAVRAERERLALEASTLRQRLQAVEDERDTLEATAAELQTELVATREALNRIETEAGQRQILVDDLELAVQREVAWRARALELERAAVVGGNLQAALQRLGLTGLDDQQRMLQAVVSHPEGVRDLLRAVRQVDPDALARVVRERLVRVCAHPVCNQVAVLDDRLPMRVDSGKDCEVCRGSADRRWFLRMVRECGRAGVRRLLVIGGPDATRDALRGLSEGQPVDVRLIADSEEVHPARVQGRVEGCDVLVLWGEAVVPRAISEPYEATALREGRPVVQILGERGGVAALARGVCNRLARDLVLRGG
jgi:hypothetical protein